MATKQKLTIKITPKEAQLIDQYIKNLADRGNHAIEQAATVCHFMLSYMSNAVDDMKKELDGMNTPFAQRIRNRHAAAAREINAFLDAFDPLISKDAMDEFFRSSECFFVAMDNFFKIEQGYADEGKRALEIRRAAALRYHDPLEKNTQRIFQEGFMKGASYADLHPTDKYHVTINGKTTDVDIADMAAAYVEKMKKKGDAK